MAPFMGLCDSTQCGTLRCQEREPSTPSMARHWRLPDPCRRGRKVGGSPQIRQRGTATRRDRQQGLDLADEIGGRHQPVTLSEAGKLCLRAVQRWGSDHSDPESRARWIKVGGNVTGSEPCRPTTGGPGLRGCGPSTRGRTRKVPNQRAVLWRRPCPAGGLRSYRGFGLGWSV